MNSFDFNALSSIIKYKEQYTLDIYIQAVRIQIEFQKKRKDLCLYYAYITYTQHTPITWIFSQVIFKCNGCPVCECTF